jgi:deoxyribonuclease-4
MKANIMLGPAGSPESSSVEGVYSVAKMGLSAMEVEFTHGVRMREETAAAVGKAAKETGVSLSVHAPYFINLASEEPAKRTASRERILKSAEMGSIMGATRIVFHPAFYGKIPKEECYSIVKEAVLSMQEEMEKRGWKTALAPETTGKNSQFGTVDELLRLRRETGCEICVDFAHILARDGKINYPELFAKLSEISHIHAHFSGIEYTDKGERRHLVMKGAEIEKLLNAAISAGSDITIISESPVTWEDSLKMKEMLEKMK